MEAGQIRPEPPKLPFALARAGVARVAVLRAALRQHEGQIVIENQDLAGPFVRLLHARHMNLRPVGTLVPEMMSFEIRRCSAPT
jgi:hypothetical protein